MFSIDKTTSSIFPVEIFKLISLHVNPGDLAVCKRLLKLYDDNWYHDHLHLKYPNINLYTKTNYKDLWKLSLLQGDIYYINPDNKKETYLNVKAIKGQLYQNNNNASELFGRVNNIHNILTFNGDYLVTDGTTLVKIDQSVNDINRDYYYIKSNRLYKWEVNKKQIINNIVYEFDNHINNMISIYREMVIYLIGDYTCYNVDSQVLRHYDQDYDQDCDQGSELIRTKRTFSNKILQIVCYYDNIVILFDNHVLMMFDKFFKYDTILEYNVTNLYGNMFKSNNDLYCYRQDGTDRDEHLNSKSGSYFQIDINELNYSVDLVASTIDETGFICINNIIYEISGPSGSVIDKEYHSNKQHLSKVKNIIGNDYILYLIV